MHVLCFASVVACGSGAGDAPVDPPIPPPAAIASISVSPSLLKLTPGATGQLSAEARQANGAVMSDAVVSWTSSAPNVVSVDRGTVMAIADGSAIITAQSGGHNASATVTVETLYDVDANGVPRFIGRDYIDLSKITRVSRFRSGIGHDYSDDVERCRSMKHYFQPPGSVDWGSIVIAAPVTGTVASLQSETTFGTQVQIVPAAQRAFTVILFHVKPNASLAVGTAVSAGESIGTHIGSQTMSDVAIRVKTPRGQRYVSYFDAMADSLFQSYATRGVPSRGAMIIGTAERDSSPLTCSGEQFQSAGVLNNWIDLQ
ncbi:MAG: Ig-like domain-containing protein [Gemmatimonadota bacterium]